MSKNRLGYIAVLVLCILSITGCARKCATCGKTIEENEQIKIGKDYYCKDCVEFCTSCNTAFVKNDPALMTINEKPYCKDCVVYCTNCNNVYAKDDSSIVTINEKPYCGDCAEYCAGCHTAYVKGDPALLTYKELHYCKDCFDEVAFPIIIEDNEKFSMSITGYDDDSGMLAINIMNKTDEDITSYDESSPVLDGKKKCVAETEGTHSFAYGDIPANEDLTLFSSFREDGDDGWENVIKMSEIHTFEFAMIVASSGDDFWDDTFKVKLSSDMFGYVKQ